MRLAIVAILAMGFTVATWGPSLHARDDEGDVRRDLEQKHERVVFGKRIDDVEYLKFLASLAGGPAGVAAYLEQLAVSILQETGVAVGKDTLFEVLQGKIGNTLIGGKRVCVGIATYHEWTIEKYPMIDRGTIREGEIKIPHPNTHQFYVGIGCGRVGPGPQPADIKLRGGTTRDIAVGANGDVWLVDNFRNGSSPGGGRIRKNTGGNNWDVVANNVGCDRVAVAPDGTVWMVNEQGLIHSYKNGVVSHRGGTARDIAVGSNGDVWLVDNFRNNQGGGRIRKNTGGNNWDVVANNVGCDRVAVAPDGTVWMVNEQGLIHSYKDGVVSHRGGTARDIAVGANGDVWLVDNFDYNQGGGKIRKNTGGNTWDVVVEVGCVALSVAPNGTVWMVNRQGLIHSWPN